MSSVLSSVGSSEFELLPFKAKKQKNKKTKQNKAIKQQVNINLDGLGIKQVESARFLGVHRDGNIN